MKELGVLERKMKEEIIIRSENSQKEERSS